MSASIIGILLVALLLDRRFGEPEWLWSKAPHPVKLLGKWIEIGDRRLNRGENTRLSGAVFIVASSAVLFWAASVLAELPGGELLELFGAFVLLAHRSLVEHVSSVAQGLRISLQHGQREVAKIVGRDVTDLNGSEVSKAAVESAAEGFVDGVVAPCFWFVIFGLPGILVYKFVNTADSMIGYRNQRYADFGMVAARFDDVLNWVPSRLAAFMLLAAGGSHKNFGAAARDARFHHSPNAGWPESAVAYALNVELGGPRSYDGASADLPYMNEGGRNRFAADDIDASVLLVNKSHRLLLGLLVFLLVLVVVI